MVHVHGAQAQQLAQATRGVDPAELVAVPVDVGKHAAMALGCDFTGELLGRPFEFPMTLAGVRLLVDRVQAATHGRAVRLVRVGVEAAGHYHQPLTSTGVLPADWQLIQISPAQVAAQRQLTGRRRLKTDALDLVAISDLLRAGHGASHRVLASALGELAGWVAHRPGPPAPDPGRPGHRPGRLHHRLLGHRSRKTHRQAAGFPAEPTGRAEARAPDRLRQINAHARWRNPSRMSPRRSWRTCSRR
jgi:hypothetical protein